LQLRVRAERIGYAGTLLAGVGREGAAERDSMPVDVRLVECAAMGF
jgi:hypothetical protein